MNFSRLIIESSLFPRRENNGIFCPFLKTAENRNRLSINTIGDFFSFIFLPRNRNEKTRFFSFLARPIGARSEKLAVRKIKTGGPMICLMRVPGSVFSWGSK